MSKTILCIFFLIICPVFIPTLFSQNPDWVSQQSRIKADQKFKFEHIDVDHGLSSNRVTSILQDSRGFMWFGTENGLHKYDGYKFTIYKPDPTDPGSISHTFIYSIFEDEQENIWVGTYGGGLNKFDRDKEKFINYRNDPENPYSLSNNFVSAICQSSADSGKALWIGTRWGGLNKLDIQTGKFYQYLTPHGNIPEIEVNNIFSICCDKKGSLWIGTDVSGLINLDPRTKYVTHYVANSTSKKGLSGNKIRSIFADKSDNIWIGTVEGLNKFDKNQNEFTRYVNSAGNMKSLSYNHVIAIHEDKQNNLWVGTHYGLNLYSKKTGNFIRFNSDKNETNSISNDYITNIYEDRSGILWIATHGGVNKFNPEAKKFNHIQVELENESKTSINSIRSIQEDIYDRKFLWIGTSGAGLIRYDRDTKEFKQAYGHDETVFARSLYQSPLFPGNIWIATWGSGLIRIDKGFKKSPKKDFWFNNPNYKDANHISTIYGLSEDKVLLGTGIGLYQFNLVTGEYFGFFARADDPNSLSHPNVTSICRDRSGQLWLGTYGGGLNKLILPPGETDLKKIDEKFVHYKNNPEDRRSLSSNTISVIYQAQNGIIWVGTLDGGLNKLVISKDEYSDIIKEEFIHYSEKDGLPSDAILGILEDNNGNLWISTKKGLSQFDPGNESFHNYDKSDGLQSNEFNRFAYFKNKSGELYFGGINGFNHFEPTSIKENPKLPAVVITDFQIFNKSVKQGPGSDLKKSIPETDEIILTHNQTVITFEFAALEYTNSVKNKYAYKMKGIDPYWVYTDASRRFATYTYLDPGEYIFTVRASNNDGIWNKEGTSIKIIITPPWWRTKFSYMLYILLGISLIYRWRRYELNRQRLKYHLELEHIEAKKLKEIDRLKSRFFANISHEFRTPLTLIIGPLSSLVSSEPDKNKKNSLIIMERNAARLLRLINQLLDFSRLESGKMKLHALKGDIVSFVKGLLMSFQSLAEQKNITARFRSVSKHLILYFDHEKAEKIFVNLLSNAFKFTPEGGGINVTVGSSSSCVIPAEAGIQRGCTQITISNTGPGIPPDRLSKIFDRFYQADDSLTRRQEGTGIGLALSKELVELHKGKIEVESEPGKETTFTVLLPVGKDHLKEDEIAKENPEPDSRAVPVSDSSIGDPISRIEHSRQKTFPSSRHVGMKSSRISQASSIQHPVSSIQHPVVLVVEDNPDMSAYIHETLHHNYQVKKAFDGQEGVDVAKKLIPDLIISDLMMPGKDGYQLCNELKMDERTNHIPIILLTAKAEKQDKLTGLRLGADDYLIKPFDSHELQIRIKNLIDQRQKLREKFIKKITVEPGDISATSMDEEFLKKAFNLVRKNMNNCQFDTAAFAREIGMSRGHLNAKIKALTGFATREFICNMRLKHAAQLLKANHGNISEIAYKVGFNNLSHFSKIFKDTFGTLPSEYISHVKS